MCYCRDKDTIVVREEIDRHTIKQYLVVDHEKDAFYVDVPTNSLHRLKVVLQDIAWLKYVKGLKSKPSGFSVKYTCDATSGELQRSFIVSVDCSGLVD